MLYTLNNAAGMLLKIPRLQIAKSGCEELADAIIGVSELYGDAFGMSEKAFAWTNLCMVAAKVYIFDAPSGPQRVTQNAPPKVPIPMPPFMVNGSGKPN